jgi:DnaJ-class molecular chaperone
MEREKDQDPGGGQPRPADESRPGVPGAGENLCRRCEGKGRLPDGSACPDCDGTGIVITEIGGA